MTPARRVFSITCALALTLGGIALTLVILTSDRVRGLLVLAAALMLGIGLFWFWSDLFNAPPKANT